MSQDWYYAVNNQQYGPVSEAELRDLAERGKLSPRDLVWKEGMPQWVAADSVRGLLPEPAPRREPDRRDDYRERDRGPDRDRDYDRDRRDRDYDDDRDYDRRRRRPSGDSNRVACGVVAILLGWLGIHKFMLGMNNAGLIMLLVSILGGIPTCGGAAFVMSIIGLVEGIIYLTKSDEEFYDLYVVQKKEWF
jgi:TM2 domain-containing membrane protein YozV